MNDHMFLEYRWRQYQGQPPRGAIMIGQNLWQVLEQRTVQINGLRVTHGEWESVPVVIAPQGEQ